MVDLELLHQYLCVVEKMNFRKAADALFISHSTVSRNMSKLESEFQTPLFIRKDRTLELTEAGQFLADHSLKLISDYLLLEKEMLAFQHIAPASLHIEIFNFFIKDFFFKYEQFNRENLNIDMSISYQDIPAIYMHVKEGTTDIGLSFSFALPKDSSLAKKVISSGEFILLASSNSVFKNYDAVDIHDPVLKDIPRIMLNEDAAFNFVMDIGKKTSLENINSKIICVQNMMDLILHVKANAGIAIIPEHIATQIGKGIISLSLDGINSDYDIEMFWRKDTKNQYVKSFLNMFVNGK